MWRRISVGLAVLCCSAADAQVGAVVLTGTVTTLVVRSTGPLVLVEAGAELQVQGADAVAQHGHAVFVDAASAALQLRVPAHWTLRIDDGAGDVTVRRRSGPTHIADDGGELLVTDPSDLRIDDKSGAIVIEQTDPSLQARVRIVDGSGPIWVVGVRGWLSIVDGGDDMAIDDFSGTIHIQDGSGHITGQDWRGTARLRDGAGDIRVSRAEHVILEHDGTGLRQFESVQRLEQKAAR